jgi:hypothetical protein
MNLEDRYKASGKNIKPSIYSGQTQQAKDNSNLNVDVKPKLYSGASKLTKDTSKLNIDVTPKKYKG